MVRTSVIFGLTAVVCLELVHGVTLLEVGSSGNTVQLFTPSLVLRAFYLLFIIVRISATVHFQNVERDGLGGLKRGTMWKGQENKCTEGSAFMRSLFVNTHACACVCVYVYAYMYLA